MNFNFELVYEAEVSTGSPKKIDTVRILCVLDICGLVPKDFIGKLSSITTLLKNQDPFPDIFCTSKL